MDNSYVKEIFNQSYNGFWRRYKDMTGAELINVSEQLVEDAGKIMTDHNNSMCQTIMQVLLDELDARAKGSV